MPETKLNQKKLDDIIVQPIISVGVKGLTRREAQLIWLLGSSGYVFELDGDWVYSRFPWRSCDKKLREYTKGVKGMRYSEIKSQLEIPHSSTVSQLILGLEKRTEKYILILSSYTSEHLCDDLVSKEVVLTRKGSRLYSRIEIAIATLKDLNLETSKYPIDYIM